MFQHARNNIGLSTVFFRRVTNHVLKAPDLKLFLPPFTSLVLLSSSLPEQISKEVQCLLFIFSMCLLIEYVSSPFPDPAGP